MSVVDDVRKGFQDFVAPEMSGLKEGLNGVKEAVQSLRVDLSDTEKRLLAAIESAKKEILLTVQVSMMAEKIAEQARIIEELKKNRPQ
jgi:D-Tyr-tRNAtyr deacylase